MIRNEILLEMLAEKLSNLDFLECHGELETKLERVEERIERLDALVCMLLEMISELPKAKKEYIVLSDPWYKTA